MRYVGAAATVTPPPAGLEAFDLTTPANGGFNPWSIPGAIHHNGVTYVGFVTGTVGDIKVVSITDAGAIVGPVTVHAGFQKDAHDAPLLWVRPSDSRLVIMYNKHNAGPLYLRVSVDPLDTTGVVTFGGATNLDGQITGTYYTDGQLHYLTSTGVLYFIFRYEPTAGSSSRWAVSTCDPANITTGWSVKSVFFYQAGARCYVISWANGVDRIDIAGMENPGDVGHAYFDGTTWYGSDGVSLGAVSPAAPLNISRLTPVYSTLPAYATNIAYIAGNPVIVGQTVSGTDLGIQYWRWDGAAWDATQIIADVGVGYEYSGAGTGYGAYGACLDDVDPNKVWLIKDVAGQPELFLYTTADAGATFSSQQITTGSTTLLITPIVVRAADDSCQVVFLKGGSWASYTSYSMGIVAVRAA